MNTFKLNGFTVAVLVSQPFSLLRASDGTILADRVPPKEFALNTTDDGSEDTPHDEFCGEPCSFPPRWGGPLRSLEAHELAADVAIVTMAPGPQMVQALRAAGFYGAIYAPGRVRPRHDGVMTAVLGGRDGLYMVAPSQRGGFSRRVEPSTPSDAKFA